jgi:imidazolonepropionase-like amidohydrolase
MSKLTIREAAPVLAGLLLGSFLATPVAAETVALKGATIAFPDGKTLKGGVILIEDGRIKAIGKEKAARGQKPIKIPYDAKVINAKGKVIFPGMVLAHTSRGMDRPNESVPVGPYLDVFDSIDPSQLFFESSLRDGVTSLHVIQGNDCVVAGLGRVVHPYGMTTDAMTSRAATALKIATSGKRGYDRVRQRAALREVFAELKDYLEKVAEKRYEEKQKEDEKEVTVPPAKARELGMALIRDKDLDDKHRNLYRLTKGRLDAFVYVERAQDARFAIELAKDNGFLARTTFVLGPETFKAVKLFQQAKRPLVLSGQLDYRETDPVTGKETKVFVPKVFADARLPFALLPGRSSTSAWLWYQAARCVSEGISRGQALSAITSIPAQICGVGKRAGQLRAGFDADLLILSGDPLEVTTRVEQVMIGGKVVYDRAKDWRLRKLISGTEKGEKKADAPKKGAPKKADAPKKGAPKKADAPKKAPNKSEGGK